MQLPLSGRRRSAMWMATCALALSSCLSPDGAVAPRSAVLPRLAAAGLGGGVVISQVYGGGGNSGAPTKNDFIELYNNSTTPQSLAGWSVQYASSTGSTWTVTALPSVTLAAGQYYLINEAAGTGSQVNTVTPDATGTIAMSATAGKVALSSTATALAVACPTGSPIVDFIGYGAANCSETSPTAALSNTTAAIRNDFGRTDTNNNSADFSIAAPAPRNTASPLVTPGGSAAGPAAVVTVTPAVFTIPIGGTKTFVASAVDANNVAVNTTYTWVSSNLAVATIDANGVATGAGVGTTNITATSANGITNTTAVTLTVNPAAGPVTTVTVAPSTWSLNVNQTKAFTATSVDANNIAVNTTYTWASSDPTVASVSASGVVTGLKVGQTNITATSANSVVSNAGVLTVNAAQGSLFISARVDPLPVGFQTQLFLSGSGTDTFGNPITNTNITWSSNNTAVVSVNPTTGVITAKDVGTAILRATSVNDGVTTNTTTINTVVAVPSAAARVGHNTELGIPTDANPNDDYIVSRKQYTLSYNPLHGGPNWVSWNLDVSHKGSSSRCNCFTQDPALAGFGFQAFDTNDWINGGAYSRGHMSPSADWAAADGDNAPTFYLTNMLPQNQTLNSGAWGALENDLRSIAVGSTQIYIIAGPIFTKNRTAPGVDGLGFINSSTQPNKIAVPDSIWKIAVVVGDTRNADGIMTPGDVQQVIAVNMPNNANGVGAYTNFSTTIDALQRSTGYNFLSMLPENVQCKLEVRNCVPLPLIGSANGSPNATVGTPFVLNTSASDADFGDGPWKYLLEWGDGTSFTAMLVSLPPSTRPLARSKVYSTPGTYTVKLTVTDKNGGKGVQTFVITVGAVAAASN